MSDKTFLTCMVSGAVLSVMPVWWMAEFGGEMIRVSLTIIIAEMVIYFATHRNKLQFRLPDFLKGKDYEND